MKKGMESWLKCGKCFLIALIACAGVSVGISAEAATKTQKEECKKEILDMYYEVDTSTHNIYKYRLKSSELVEIVEELKEGEGRVIMGAYLPETCISYTTKSNVVSTITLMNVDSNVSTRYNTMVKNIDCILAEIEPGMTDLDKVLYLHDELVELVTYGGNGRQQFMAGGALGDQKAVCSGYAKALNVLLSKVGLETDYVKASTIDHGWTYVKLDGEWYHIDPTWDDTRSPQYGEVARMYLLRNDAEMLGHHGASAPLKETEKSDSKIYSDWFVHGIVGEMCYENGLWYYEDEKKDCIMRSDIEGNLQEAVVDCSRWSNVELVDVDGKNVIITADGSTQIIVAEPYEANDEKEPIILGNSSSDVGSGSSNIGNNASYPMVQNTNLSDFSNWKSGMYHYENGKYVIYNTRICLNDYVSCESGAEYHIEVSDSAYQVLIREMDANMQMIVSNNLKSGTSLVTRSNTKYMAISLYKPSNESTVYSDYEKLFKNGFEITVSMDELVEDETNAEIEQPIGSDKKSEVEDVTENKNNAEQEENVENETDAEQEKVGLKLETLDFKDFNNWKSGIYNWTDGKYMVYPQRICLVDYVTFSGDAYWADISNSIFKILVRELDADGKFIKSTTLSNGKIFVPDRRTVYLGISVYRDLESGLNFEQFRQMFAEGFYAKIIAR